MIKSKTLMWSVALASTLVLSGCGRKEDGNTAQNAEAAMTQTAQAGRLYTMMVGSELKDMKDTVVQCTQGKGFGVKMSFVGSLEAVDRLQEDSKTQPIDFVWLANNRFAKLVPSVAQRLERSDKIMQSPVVIGIRQETLSKYGWKWAQEGVTWKELLGEVKARGLGVAMTNPVTSNSGFSGLMALASALAQKQGDALTDEDLKLPQVQTGLKDWMSGVTLTAGSSDYLVSKWKSNPELADLMVGYGASLKTLKAQGDNLVMLIPKEGVVWSDYPLMKMKSAGVNVQRDQDYEQLLACLKSPEVQEGAVKQTYRNQEEGKDVLDVPFPAKMSTVEAVLEGIRNEYSKPSKSYWVLDTSDSMNDAGRLEDLKSSMIGLMKSDATLSGRFSTIKDREEIQLVTFDAGARKEGRYTFNRSEKAKVSEALVQKLQRLRTGPGTSIYDGLMLVYEEAAKDMKAGNPVNIVLMTDGENNMGAGANDFFALVQKVKQTQGVTVPVLAILYGDAEKGAMQQIVDVTKGVLFDAQTQSLRAAIKTVRTYQ